MILAFHGCPGLPEDFEHLSSELKKSPTTHSIRTVIRKGYPGAKSQKDLLASSPFYLGYSFGCADAVEAASKDPEAQGIILIAPYLYPTKETGAGLRALLAIPVLSDTLLSLFGKKAMKELIEKTSHPVQAPESYIKTGDLYSKPAILKTAMTETRGRGPGILAALEDLKQRKLPILLIWGKQDQVSSEAVQIEPLRKFFPSIREQALDHAGHALLWTHPETLAQELSNFTGGTI